MALSVDSLIAKMDAEPEFTFEVAGETLRARTLADATAVLNLERKVGKIRKLIDAKQAPAEWKEYLPADAQIIRFATFCEELMIDPPMPFIDGLKMAKMAGMLFLQIGAAVIEKASGNATTVESELLDEAKNESSETATTGIS